jgi:hypothetical protein
VCRYCEVFGVCVVCVVCSACVVFVVCGDYRCEYGCETWSLTLRDEHRRKVFGNRVLGEYLELRGTR